MLDDYYTIQDAAVHDFLSALLRHWPARLHLVLISRSNPPLPLAKLRATGQVAEIRTRDLRFRPDESAEFLSKVLPAPLSESAMAMLEERLEGWIAGLRLVTLSLGAAAHAEHDLADLSGTPFRDCRLPGERSHGQPAACHAEIPAGDLDPGPVLRPAVRKCSRQRRRPGRFCVRRPGLHSVARAQQPLCDSPGRPQAMVPLSSPVPGTAPAETAERSRSGAGGRAPPQGRSLVRRKGSRSTKPYAMPWPSTIWTWPPN